MGTASSRNSQYARRLRQAVPATHQEKHPAFDGRESHGDAIEDLLGFEQVGWVQAAGFASLARVSHFVRGRSLSSPPVAQDEIVDHRV
jgi:hypothetical protein